MMRRVVILVLPLLLGAAGAAAQPTPGPPDPATVRVRVGPLWLSPTVALTNAGIDTNVFNDATDPKRDFTVTISPQTELWLRMGRTWLDGVVKEDINWYKKYASERSADNSYTLGWDVPLTRVNFTASTTWLTTRERPGYEIDERAQHSELDFDGTAEIRVLSKTSFGVKADQQTIDFNQNDTFLGVNLHDELNHTTTSGALTINHQLTPLTTFTMDLTRSQDRFKYTSLRDSNSTEVNFGLKFDKFALLTGTATVGFRDFEPLSSTVPGYKGSTAAVNVAYVAFGSTKLTVGVTRDVQYSFDINQPYYLQTGLNGSITQQVFGPLDVQLQLGTDSLAYRDMTDGSVEFVDRVDHIRLYGVGVGYHLGKNLRLAFNVTEQKRESLDPTRRYDGLQAGTSLTYIF